jgi:rubrerythrin
VSSTKDIDFSALSLRDALDLAVLVEEEAKERYEEFADQMKLHHNPDAARFFRFMSGNEEKHRADLWKRRVELFGETAVQVNRGMLFDVEAPDYDEARAFMTVREALQSALRSEQKAHAFFEAALPQITQAEVQALFTELRDEEIEHQQMVQAELDKLPPDSKFKAEDFADEPVAQ